MLDPRLASLSIEFSYLTAFGGNKTDPNLLTKELMQRLVERTGVGPDVRPGGITVDSTIFSPDAPALVLDESSSGGIYRTTFGPALYESLLVFPNSTKFVVTVNMGNDTILIARDEIAAAVEYIGWDRIRAIELGNEADHYAGSSRPSGWASSDYTAQFLGWTSVLSRNLSLPPHIFQAGGFADDPTPSALMTTVDIINEGVDTTRVIELFAQHTYQYSTCDPVRNAIATLPNLINHQNITAYLDLWKPQIAAAKSRGKDFVVGEFSSVSCSGKENVTDTFGQALWLADTILYGAALNISRMYLHQGATLVFQSSVQANSPGFSWYDLWYPIPTDRYGSARASPSFVAYLLIAEAVGPSTQSQLALLPSPEGLLNLAAYAIWDPAVRAMHDGPARLALLNLAIRNVSTSQSAGEVQVDLTAWTRNGTQARVKRMTAPGLDSKDSDTATWAGQSYTNGTASGDENIEQLDGGKVAIKGSEAVLVFF
ncbi:glycoside hydrolase family 79 protein [Phanerochaete carnosa HHB-10118-sp]|uniref:Glycoside hydrolase family 79 protein n=1 Tax=Phanerochaete carnosa (strain HHB-10118-sp) TaxID=650164 RepID=K5V6K3_PHACS|nr:glycoside hydrolase family 79 protein [Phanerochaete carnosa HHB-10118-sp]EKM58316.1 glycoside hydrolase family 79 protein [Phanerochaete carnosa HHB-10118-sp]